MTFVKLTGVSGKPLLLKYELIESAGANIVEFCSFEKNSCFTEEVGTTIKLTNGHEYTVEETVEEVEKNLEGFNDNSNDNI